MTENLGLESHGQGHPAQQQEDRSLAVLITELLSSSGLHPIHLSFMSTPTGESPYEDLIKNVSGS